MAASCAALASSQTGCTPLHFACMKAAGLDAAKLLLDRGADVDATSNVRAAQRRNSQTAESLTPVCVSACVQGTCFTPLHFAARDGGVALVQLLLERGANKDARNKVR